MQVPDVQSLKLQPGDFAKMSMNYATVTLWKLRKHASSELHVVAESLVNADPNATDPTLHGACPANKDWEEVMRETIQGKPCRISGVPVAARDKLKNMQWCLAAAKRQHLQKVISQAESISLSFDKRGTRLLIRFRCADKSLQVTQGLLSLQRLATGAADDIRLALMQGFQRFFRNEVPPRACGLAVAAGLEIAEALDKTQFEAALLKVEHLVADGASPEQLSIREAATGLNLAGPTTPSVKNVLSQGFPNVKASGVI